MNLLQILKKYAEISDMLKKTVFDYNDCFANKENSKVKIEELEILIQALYTEFLNYAKIVVTILEQKLYINEKVVENINNEFLGIFWSYSIVTATFESLKKEHPDYDFVKVLNVAVMESQKDLLDKAIEAFNLRLLSNSGFTLYTMNECVSKIKEMFSKELI